MLPVHVSPAGDTGLLVTVDAERASPDALPALTETLTEAIVSMWRALVRAPPPWLVWAQPAYRALQVTVDADADLDLSFDYTPPGIATIDIVVDGVVVAATSEVPAFGPTAIDVDRGSGGGTVDWFLAVGEVAP